MRMRFAAHRFMALLLSVFLSSLVVFLVLNALPGDRAAFVLGLSADPDSLQSLQAQLRLDASLVERYGEWGMGVLRGDLGVSHAYHAPVWVLIYDRMLVTLPLAFVTLLVSTALAFPLGIGCAVWKGRPVDLVASGIGQLGFAVPNFWLALLLIWWFGLTLGYFPVGSFPGWEAGFLVSLSALCLPALTLSLPQASILMRIVRSVVSDALLEAHVRAARARGAGYGYALWYHAVRPSLAPVLNVIGLQFGFLLSGTLIVEQVFFLPGLGQLLIQAVMQRDLVLVQGVIVFLVSMMIVVNFCIDLICALFDPRMEGRI